MTYSLRGGGRNLIRQKNVISSAYRKIVLLSNPLPLDEKTQSRYDGEKLKHQSKKQRTSTFMVSDSQEFFQILFHSLSF